VVGAILDVELLVEAGNGFRAGNTVLLALTALLKYIVIPVYGLLVYTPDSKNKAVKIVGNPYTTIPCYILPYANCLIP
jgi:hypothetical protein